MRFGLNAAPPHSSPEEWAEILTEKGYRAASFPVNYTAPVSLIDAYVKAAKEKGIDSMPAFSPVYFADRLREVVDIPEDINAVFGIGLGYAEDCVYNKPVAERMPLEKFVKYFE